MESALDHAKAQAKADTTSTRWAKGASASSAARPPRRSRQACADMEMIAAVSWAGAGLDKSGSSAQGRQGESWQRTESASRPLLATHSAPRRPQRSKHAEDHHHFIIIRSAAMLDERLGAASSRKNSREALRPSGGCHGRPPRSLRGEPASVIDNIDVESRSVCPDAALSGV